METTSRMRGYESSGSDFDKMPAPKSSPFIPLNQEDFSNPRGSESLQADLVPTYKKKTIAQPTETIREWWVGTVTNIDNENQFFTAKLFDPYRNISSIAEIEFSQAFEDGDYSNLFEGAEFAFYIYTIHGLGSPSTTIGMEFNTPYIWSEKDEEKAKNIYQELFPDG